MSTSNRSASAFASANPHALAAILEASETRRIIAATDIFDLAGTKLWARNQPVSAELQRKLLDRKLREPLEACLVAEDGVTPASLAAALAQRIDSDGGLAPLLRPQATLELGAFVLAPSWKPFSFMSLDAQGSAVWPVDRRRPTGSPRQDTVAGPPAIL